MSFDCTNLDRMLTDITQYLQSNFDTAWPLYPGCAGQQILSVTQTQRNNFLSHQDAHRSVRFEFCCVLEGTSALQVENEIISLHEGQLFLIPAGVLHNDFSDGQVCTVAWFVFFRDGVHINISGFCPDGTFQVFLGQRVTLDAVTINLLLNDLTRELTSQQPDSKVLIKCSLLQLLILLQRRLKSQKTQTPEQWQQSVVLDVISHLQENPGIVPDINQLADRCALSPHHLGTIFRSVTGKTISAYCAELRIDRAKELLGTTSMKLRQIAETLGYYDQYHFCKAFKKATGISPSAYRAEVSGK